MNSQKVLQIRELHFTSARECPFVVKEQNVNFGAQKFKIMSKI